MSQSHHLAINPGTRTAQETWREACSVLLVLALFGFLGHWLGRFAPLARSWTVKDLRVIDDNPAPDPVTDLTAIYTRPAGFRCEIRLDFLELPETPQYDFWLKLPGQKLRFKHDLALPLGVRLAYDSAAETLTVSLSDCPAQAATPLVVETVSERLITTFDAQPVFQAVGLQFEFYNTFAPAATPAQALRRWDGAHTGPRGERHGLHGLLEAAEKHQVPLTLLDVKTPVALSAIEAAAGLEQLRRIEQAGLLNMPVVASAPAPAAMLALGRQVARQFNLDEGGSFDATNLPVGAPFQWQELVTSRAGLPLETRRELLRRALGGDLPLLVGGDFQHSTWGTYEYAEPALAYLAARPYIQFVNAYALNVAPVEAVAAPGNAIAASALQMRTMLAQADPALAANYAGLADQLEAAAAWAEHPAPLAECRSVCVLASEQFYALLSPQGGRLVFLFAGEDQLVGPTAQFFVGLSDRSRWELSNGEGADPEQVMGAFADAENAFRPYTATIAGKTLRFVAADGFEKTYQLTEKGLEVRFSGPLETQIPLVVAPQARFFPDWAGRYRLEPLVNGLRFGVAGGPMVRVTVTGGQVRAGETFLAAFPSLAFPENPNTENPSGFYLPFPLMLAQVSGLSGATISISVSR